MPYIYKVKNIGGTKPGKAIEKKLNDLGSEDWELIAFQCNNDKTLTGIFKKVKLSSENSGA
ncbi:MAG: hypothetical protein O8C66_09940 [Candidatus Methanoperedens sp.]|nr:hypothetical protein [Candidatus Methanoperedens sp.]MCZ7370816.1 hypothetical protein [Candidatus Methanoperedens sp.]